MSAFWAFAFSRSGVRHFLLAGLGFAAVALTAPAANAQNTDPASESSLQAYFDDWFNRVDRAQAAQPHWITPVATTTPRLEEEFRYDQFFEKLGNGGTLHNFDGGKGLELIPSENVELIFGLPPYIERSQPTKPRSTSGFNDLPFLLVKYRLLSANEQSGNYIVTAFLQGSAPTGIEALSQHTYLITPTLAAGWGYGDFDIQSTIGIAFPTDYSKRTGDIVTWNTTLQYHIWKIWPELEMNDTFWLGGTRAGRHQIFLTPGAVLGRFPFGWRAKAIVGVGYQVAVGPNTVRTPLTPQYRNNLILTFRVAF